jgi:integration host factor subunit alpha
MTNKQFISALAKNSGLTTTEAAVLLDQFSIMLVDSIAADQTVNLQSFGTFSLKTKSEKRAYNPTTKQFKLIPASKSITFRQSSILKDKLADGDRKEDEA